MSRFSMRCGIRDASWLPESRVRRVLVGFLVTWLWVALAYMGISPAQIGDPLSWALVGIASLIYLLFLGIPVYVLMRRFKIVSVNGYLLGALLAGTPIVGFLLAVGGFVAAGHAAFVAIVGGFLGYWIVERPNKSSG